MMVALLYLSLFSRVLFAAGQAQQSAPPKLPAAGAQIVRIEYGRGAGMCIGYCDSETVIREGVMRTLSRTNYSLSGRRDREHPDIRSKWKITPEQWERAKAAIDTESLFALPDRMGCPGCVDEAVDWITVEYSDGTKKSVMCNSGDRATDIIDKVKAALQRPAKDAKRQP